MEEWKGVKGYEGIYEVSTYGQIKSLDRMIFNKNKKYQKANGTLLKFKKTKEGYYSCVLYNNERKKAYLLVHRVVAQNFISKTEEQIQVNHKNGVKTDNRVENLEWVTRKENIDHSIENGLTKIGSDSTSSKLKDNQVLEIRELFSSQKYSYSELGRMFNVDGAGIGRIIRGETWKHLPVKEYNFDIDAMPRKRREYVKKATDEEIALAVKYAKEKKYSKRKVAMMFNVSHPTITRWCEASE